MSRLPSRGGVILFFTFKEFLTVITQEGLFSVGRKLFPGTRTMVSGVGCEILTLPRSISIKVDRDLLIVRVCRISDGREVWRTYAVRRDGASAGRLRALAKTVTHVNVRGVSVLKSYGRCRSVSRDISLRWHYDVSGQPSLVGGGFYGFIYVS
jgi:hypothetical protein